MLPTSRKVQKFQPRTPKAQVIFSRDSRFCLEPAHHTVNYSGASGLTLRGLTHTVPSFRNPKLHLTDRDCPGRGP